VSALRVESGGIVSIFRAVHPYRVQDEKHQKNEQQRHARPLSQVASHDDKGWDQRDRKGV